MATKFSNTLQCSNSTDALFRAWVQFVHDTLINGGWVDPGDTGQLNIATAVHPTTVPADVGYRIYRMADALQATAPIYMKLVFGSVVAANNPRITVTFGASTDGAGNLTSGGFGLTIAPSPGTNATSACNSYGAAGTSWASFMMFVRAGANDLLVWSVERTKDANGADTTEGLLVAHGNAGQVVFTSFVLRVGAQPPAELGVATTLSNQNTATAFAGDVGVGLLIFFKGVAQPPGLGIIAVNGTDFPAEASVPFNVYGAAHNFQIGNSVTNQVGISVGNNGFASRANTRVGIRYE